MYDGVTGLSVWNRKIKILSKCFQILFNHIYRCMYVCVTCVCVWTLRHIRAAIFSHRKSPTHMKIVYLRCKDKRAHKTARQIRSANERRMTHWHFFLLLSIYCRFLSALTLNVKSVEKCVILRCFQLSSECQAYVRYTHKQNMNVIEVKAVWSLWPLLLHQHYFTRCLMK